MHNIHHVCMSCAPASHRNMKSITSRLHLHTNFVRLIFHLFILFLSLFMRILPLFVLATSALALAKEYQTPFSAQHLAEEELLSATEQWLHTDSIQKSCSSCISLMQIVKNLSFMSEAFLIATLTNVCQRTQKVDKEVVCCPFRPLRCVISFSI